MDKFLKPKCLDLNVADPAAIRQFEHWMATCEKFMANLKLPTSYEERVNGDFTKEMAVEEMKLDVLNNLVSSDIWMDIRNCATYTDAKNVLTALFVKAPSEVFARHRLLTTKQQPDQSLEAFRRILERQSRDCNFTDVTAARYREDSMLNAFIAGISENDIRKRLLEEKTLTFDVAYNLAITLHEGHKEANSYDQSHARINLNAVAENVEDVVDNSDSAAASFNNPGCGKCGRRNCWDRNKCRAKNSKCFECGIVGHWSMKCPKKRQGNRRQSFTRHNRGQVNQRIMAASEEQARSCDVMSASMQHVSANNIISAARGEHKKSAFLISHMVLRL